MIRRLPLRARVAAAFALATAVALLALGAFVYYRVEDTLMDRARAALDAQLDALAQVPPSSRPAATRAMSGEYFGQVLTPDGGPVASAPQVAGVLVPPGGLPVPGGEDVALEQALVLAGEDEPEPALLLARRTDGQVLVVGTSREDIEDALGGVLTQLLVGGPLALAVAAAMGYVVAGAALRPMERMRRRAATISANSSDERLPLPIAHDEIHRLGRTLNDMLDRLDAALRHERRFVAEASHELRTPLAMLRMELDLALSRSRTHEELLAALRSASDEVERLSSLSEDLLVLAASDEGRLALHEEQVDVGALLGEVATRFATRAGAAGRRIEVSGDSAAYVRGDRMRLDQAVSNLVDNALRHGAGAVRIDARSEGPVVSISVADEGLEVDPGLPADAFDRFTRGAGTRTVGNRGLGLAIVRAVVEQHRGTVAVAAASPGYGTIVTLTIPGYGEESP